MQVKEHLMYSKEELKKVVDYIRNKNIPVRANVVLVKDYIDSLDEIHKMIEFCKDVGFNDIKFGELTARNEHTHFFISKEVLDFNYLHYVPIPDKKLYDKCHNIGGTHLWKKDGDLSIYFNSAPDISISGGLDSKGEIYHRVLYCDEQIGNSWNREDGIYSVPKYLELVKKR